VTSKPEADEVNIESKGDKEFECKENALGPYTPQEQNYFTLQLPRKGPRASRKVPQTNSLFIEQLWYREKSKA
jgi:hypothetical protein